MGTIAREVPWDGDRIGVDLPYWSWLLDGGAYRLQRYMRSGQSGGNVVSFFLLAVLCWLEMRRRGVLEVPKVGEVTAMYCTRLGRGAYELR